MMNSFDKRRRRLAIAARLTFLTVTVCKAPDAIISHSWNGRETKLAAVRQAKAMCRLGVPEGGGQIAA
jgi:hypothetical protein